MMRLLAILLALALPASAMAQEPYYYSLAKPRGFSLSLPFSAPGQLGLGFLPQQDHIRMACWPGIADGTPDAWECLARGPEGGVADLAPVTVQNATSCGTTEGLGGSTAWGPITDACAPYIAAADAAALSLGDVFAGDHTVLAAGVPAASRVLYDGGVTVAQGSCTWGAAVAQAGAASAWGVHACRWSGGTGTARYNGTETSGAATSTTYAGDLWMGRAATAGSAVGGAMQWLVVYDTTLAATESVTPESLTWGAIGDDLRAVSEGRATSKACGSQTLGPNAPCVTGDGLLIETGDSTTVSTEGWPVEAGEVCVVVAPGSAGTTRYLWDTSGTSRFRAMIGSDRSLTVVLDAVSVTSPVLAWDGDDRVCAGWSGAAVRASVNGATVATGAGVTPGDFGTMYLGRTQFSTGYWLEGYLRLLGVKAQ